MRGRRTRLVKSALLPLILRPCCFKYIFSWLFVSASTSFSFFQEILDGRAFLSLTLFFAFASKNSRYSDFYSQSRPRCTGNRTLAKTFLQRSTIFPHWTISSSGHLGEVYKLTLQSNQTVYIYIVQFIAIKVNS